MTDTGPAPSVAEPGAFAALLSLTTARTAVAEGSQKDQDAGQPASGDEQPTVDLGDICVAAATVPVVAPSDAVPPVADAQGAPIAPVAPADAPQADVVMNVSKQETVAIAQALAVPVQAPAAQQPVVTAAATVDAPVEAAPVEASPVASAEPAPVFASPALSVVEAAPQPADVQSADQLAPVAADQAADAPATPASPAQGKDPAVPAAQAGQAQTSTSGEQNQQSTGQDDSQNPRPRGERVLDAAQRIAGAAAFAQPVAEPQAAVAQPVAASPEPAVSAPATPAAPAAQAQAAPATPAPAPQQAAAQQAVQPAAPQAAHAAHHVAAAPVAAPAAPVEHSALSHAGTTATVEKIHELVRISSLRDGTARATLQLKPAELGTVNVHLRTTLDGLVATIHAQDATALSALRQAGTELQQSLQDRGVNLARIELGLSSGDGSAAKDGRQTAQAFADGRGSGGDRGRRENANDGTTAESVVELEPVVTTHVLPDGVLVDVRA